MNKNSLSSLNIQYIDYFYLYYQNLIKIFPNIFPQSFITLFLNLIKYINCSLIRFNSNINYLSCISSSLSSNISNIKCLVSLISELPRLVNNVFCKLKSAIGLNVALLCLHINKIDCSIKCFSREIHGAIKIINCIITLMCKCTIGIVKCFKDCLNQIKCKLVELHPIFLTLYDKFGEIKHLIKDSSSVRLCPDNLPMFKSKVSLLKEKYKCSTKDFGCIQDNIKCARSKIAEISRLKQDLCKQFEKILLLICISSEEKSIKILITNGKAVNKKLECLGQKIEKIRSEFSKIEGDNTESLKHSLLFNSYYLQISSYILEHLECINSSVESIKSKTGDISTLSSGISEISDNIKEISPVIDKMHERRDDLGYIRDSLCSIIPKLSQIKEIATKIKQLQCVVNGLYRIKSSIENLKKIEHDVKCLQILECTDTGVFIRTVTCIRDKLDINCITSKISVLENGISSLESVICNINKLLRYIETPENILSVIEYLNRNINKLASCKFIQCSLQSTNNCTVTVLNDNNINEVYGLYSMMNVMDYKVIVNRLYDSAKKIDQILQLVPWYDSCQCILALESRVNIRIDLDTKNVKNIIDQITKENNSGVNDDLKLDQIKKLLQNDIEDNRLCLCMIVKYILYPKIIRISIGILGMDLDALSTLSRKFQKYAQSTHFRKDLEQFLIMMINLVNKLSIFMERRYLWATSKIKVNPDLLCFCRAPDDPYYPYLISTILFVSSLMENIWTMDTESIRMAIESLSCLLSEFERIDFQNNKSYDLNIFKLSFVSVLSSSTQSCKLLARLRIIIDLVSLSKTVRVLEPFIRRYISNISVRNLIRFDNVINQMKQYTNIKDYIGWVLKQYESVSSSKGCNNSNCCCSICVNSMILWASIYICLKVNIKLYESRPLYKERLTNLMKRICCCKEDDCCCKELQSFCDQICGIDCSANCGAGCVCKELQESCKAICGNGGAGNCLCKQITDKIAECLKKCDQGTCECKNKEGCCLCPSCKLLRESVRILTKACRANVLEPYKRIVLDLMSANKDKRELVRSIVNAINRSMVNKAYLLKISYSSYPDSIGSYRGVKDASSSNWGYDTGYEHEVTGDNSYSENKIVKIVNYASRNIFYTYIN